LLHSARASLIASLAKWHISHTIIFNTNSVWPDLSMLQYQQGAPKLKAICDKHGVPYIQESVWERLRKTVDVMVGSTSMPDFPTHLEPAKDKAGASGVTWKSTHGAIDDDEDAALA
jgi:hypothetical protein